MVSMVRFCNIYECKAKMNRSHHLFVQMNASRNIRVQKFGNGAAQSLITSLSQRYVQNTSVNEDSCKSKLINAAACRREYILCAWRTIARTTFY